MTTYALALNVKTDLTSFNPKVRCWIWNLHVGSIKDFIEDGKQVREDICYDKLRQFVVYRYSTIVVTQGVLWSFTMLNRKAKFFNGPWFLIRKFLFHFLAVKGTLCGHGVNSETWVIYVRDWSVFLFLSPHRKLPSKENLSLFWIDHKRCLWSLLSPWVSTRSPKQSPLREKPYPFTESSPVEQRQLQEMVKLNPRKR